MFDSTFWILLPIIGTGLAIFIISMLLDGVFDLGDFPLAQALGIFMAGGAASILIIDGLGVVDFMLAVFIGAGVGVLLVVALVKLIAAAKRSEHQGRIVDFDQLIGSAALVVWWDETRGDVLVEVSGQRIKIPAESAKIIPNGARLKVTDFDRVGDSLVKVAVEAIN